jgi:transposase-like protein
MGIEFICEYCGNEVQKRRNDHQYKYCSRDCYYNARYGEIISGEMPAMRNPLCLEAFELCRLGLNKSEAARRTGINIGVLNDWLRKYGSESAAEIFSGRICCHCGKSLEGMKRLSKRKYCSKKCESRAAYSKKYPIPKLMKFDPELRAKALEMYWGGVEGTFVARHLNVAEGTVHSWIHDFGRLRRRRRVPEIIALLPPEDRFTGAKSAREWKSILRENAPGDDAEKVYLVCGVFDGRGETEYLAACVADLLKRDPYDGIIYAFCGLARQQISTLQFTQGRFRFTKLPKSQGTYIWPERSAGAAIDVQKNEFDYLLTLRKKRGKNPCVS